MSGPDVSWLSEFNADDGLQLLLLSGVIHYFPNNLFDVMEINVVATNVFDFTFHKVRMD